MNLTLGGHTMEYVKLGNSGLEVSKICVGTMGMGDINRNWIHSWVIDENESEKLVKYALDQGINFFDTANIYSLGSSEEFLGKALKKYAKREDVVIATKVYMSMREGQNTHGLSRKAILFECDESLRRLQTDYIDLYIIHRFDYNTPIEETMRALHDLVVSGKVRYIGASSMYAWQFQAMQTVAEKNGWTKFISMQNHYNLMYREEEREMIPYCKTNGVALTPYSPLASGRLVKSKEESSKRLETDKTQESKYGKMMESDQVIIDRVAELALKKNVLKSQIAMAWLYAQEGIVAPIVGVTKQSHIDDAIKALSVNLSLEECVYLEEAYVPHPMMGPNPYPKQK